MKNSVNRYPAGFSLVELLVVIVIIVTLAALSMVGFGRMRKAGDRAAAVAIMRQLVVANVGYSTDNNGQFVPIAEKDENGGLAMEWYRNPKFLTYLTGDPAETEKSGSQLLLGPVGSLDPIVVRSKKRQWDRLSASYGLNATGLTWPANSQSPPMSFKVSQIANPGRTAFIVSATNYQVTYGGRFLWKSSPVEGKTTTDKIAYRHGNQAVVVYYDSSIGFVTQSDLAAIDGNGGVSNAFWKATP